MKKLRRKRMLLQGVSAVCNMGGTWMVVVTVCQIVQSAERETVGGFVVGMLAALAYGLCALLLWSYGLDLAEAARRITRKVARMQAEEMLVTAIAGMKEWWRQNPLGGGMTPPTQ